MTPRTRTILGELRQGDRFFFLTDKAKVAYEVIEADATTSQVSINQPTDGLKEPYAWKNPFLRKKTVEVVFLRHTIESDITPQPIQ